MAAAPGLSRLELRTDGRALVPAAAPEVRYDREVRQRFALRDPIAVVLWSTHPDGIFRPETLRRVRDLTAELKHIDGVVEANVLSLATEVGFRHQPGTLRFRTLLDPLPESASQIAELRADLRRIELYDGILVSRDGTGAAILIGTPPDADRPALLAEVRRVAAATATGDHSVDVVGAPVAEALLGRHILADLGVPRGLLGDETGGADPVLPIGLVPLAIALMGVIFLLAFRRPAAALLPLVEVGGALAIVFGVMGWLGVPIYLTTAVLPVILTAVGVADEVHIFRRFLDLSRQGRSEKSGRAARVRATLEEMTPPVVRTSLTTAAAFLSFTLSPIGPVRAFGAFAAFGVVVCMAWSLTVIPACLVLIDDRQWLAHKRTGGERSARRFASLAGFTRRHRAAVLALAGVASLAALDGARRLEVQDSWLSGFAPESGLARAIRRFDDAFLGSHLLQVVVETDAPRLEGTVDAAALGQHHLELEDPTGTGDLGPNLEGARIRVFRPGGNREWTTWIETVRVEDSRAVLTMPRRRGSAKFWLRPTEGERIGYEIRAEPLATPAVLERVRALETFLEHRPEVGGVLGPARLLETAGFMVRPDDPDSRRLPADPGEARNRWRNYSRIRGEERLRRLVDADFSAGLITVYLPGSNYTETRRLSAALDDYRREHLEPHGIRLGLAGDVAVSQAMIRAVVSSQVRSLLLSLAVIFTVAALFGRSWRWGLYCVLPPAFAVLLDFAAMGWLGIPLGVATSMFAAMTLGVGVDFAIHLLSRRRRLRRAGHGDAEATAGALATTGPAIAIDAAAVGLGFGLLVLSQVPANARLGGLLAASILGCLAATLLFIPALSTDHRKVTQPSPEYE